MKELIKNILWLIVMIGIMVLFVINGLFEQGLGMILFMLFFWGYGVVVFSFNIYTILQDKKEEKKK